MRPGKECLGWAPNLEACNSSVQRGCVSKMGDVLGDLLDLGLYAGTMMLESGAEVYRIEDTMDRMLRSTGANEVSSLVTPTGIFLSVDVAGTVGTRIGRVRQRSTNLRRVSAVNGLSRSLRDGIHSPIQVLQELRMIEQRTAAYPFGWQLASATVGGTAFAALFGASGPDLPAAALASLIVFAVVSLMSASQLPRLLADFAGGFLAAVVALSLTSLVPTMHYDRVILGAIMSLVPGVLLTTAVRDMLAGDLLSGTTRMSEALFIAAAIAAGVGSVLGWWIRWVR